MLNLTGTQSLWLLNILVKCQVTKYHTKNQTVTLIGDIMSTMGRKRSSQISHPHYRSMSSTEYCSTYLSLWLIRYNSSEIIQVEVRFHGDIRLTLLFDRAPFSLCNISSNIEKTEDNSLFGVKLLIHHWTSNLHAADYESSTMKATREFKQDPKKEVNTRSRKSTKIFNILLLYKITGQI